jgi:uncharacterized protein
LYHLPNDDHLKNEVLDSIFNTIVLKDVVERYQVRNTVLLEKIIRFLFDNIGNITNAKRIADFCKSQRISVGVETVQNYIHYVKSCFIVQSVSRNDLRGRKILEVNDKVFVTDTGMRNALLRRKTEDIGALLENCVYGELRRRGFSVTIGYYGDYEIDFVAEKDGGVEYYQVTYLMEQPETINREFRALKVIPDNYPKYILSMDQIDLSRDGIIHLHIEDWLLQR